jgi:hypothetical protein
MSDDPSPALQAFQALVNSGGWVPLPGPPNQVIRMHPWPDGTVDTLVLLSEDQALIERTNPVGQPVWRTNSTVTEVIAAYHELPPPMALDAPRSPLAAPHRDRDMGTP